MKSVSKGYIPYDPVYMTHSKGKAIGLDGSWGVGGDGVWEHRESTREVLGGDELFYILGKSVNTWTHIYVELYPSKTILLIYVFIYCLFIFDRERKRARERGRERSRERGRHRSWSRLQALNHQHRAQHGARTHEPPRSWPELKSDA